jgi:hypothetical protein
MTDGTHLAQQPNRTWQGEARLPSERVATTASNDDLDGGPPLGSSGPNRNLIRFFSTLFSSTLSCQGFFHTLLLARFEVKRVTPDLLDDVFLLHLAFEATQRVFEGLALLQSNFCQSNHLPASNQSRTLELTSFARSARTECQLSAGSRYAHSTQDIERRSSACNENSGKVTRCRRAVRLHRV